MGHFGRLAVAALLATTFGTACSGMNSKPTPASISPKQTLLNPAASSGTLAAATAFAPIRQSGEETVCGSFLPPRLITIGGDGARDSTFNVDVVVGTDGAVESVLILDETQTGAQSIIADRISRWVYKPALCNGVPVAAEGTIEIRGK